MDLNEQSLMAHEVLGVRRDRQYRLAELAVEIDNILDAMGDVISGSDYSPTDRAALFTALQGDLREAEKERTQIITEIAK